MLAEAHDLVVRRGGREVFRGSFEIPADGRATAVIGPNGSGKSTLLHLLTGLIQPASGRINVLGKDPRKAARQLSYVLQHGSIQQSDVPMTVREAVRMGRFASLGRFRRFEAEDHRAVDAAMDRMALQDLADRQINQLSGGQRQRMLVAQGLAQPHRALLLDEPLTGLDLLSIRTIHELFHGDRPDGTAIVFTTHDLDEAMRADHVLLLGQWKVWGSGPPERVCTRRLLDEAFGLTHLHERPE